MQELKKGIYRHYKGRDYEVLHVARHSETLEYMVVYRQMYGNNEIWVRPLSMFMETVHIGGKAIPRFEYREV
jgi:cyclomaltodextrinase